jgi:hypothetical protein
MRRKLALMLTNTYRQQVASALHAWHAYVTHKKIRLSAAIRSASICIGRASTVSVLRGWRYVCGNQRDMSVRASYVLRAWERRLLALVFKDWTAASKSVLAPVFLQAKRKVSCVRRMLVGVLHGWWDVCARVGLLAVCGERVWAKHTLRALIRHVREWRGLVQTHARAVRVGENARVRRNRRAVAGAWVAWVRGWKRRVDIRRGLRRLVQGHLHRAIVMWWQGVAEARDMRAAHREEALTKVA